MSKKGFTLIEILAVITIIGIILLITIPIASRLIIGTEERIYKTNEKALMIAAKNYYMENLNLLPIDINEQKLITLEELVSVGFYKVVKSLKNKSIICEGYVIVKKISIRNYSYSPYLKCGDDYITPGYDDLNP